MPGAEQTRRIDAARKLATALVALWLDAVDEQERLHIIRIADGVVFADLQAAQYTAQRRALAPIIQQGVPRPLDGGCTHPHGVRSEVATHLVAVHRACLDVDALSQWAVVAHSLDVLWPSSSLQARAICGDLLPSSVDS
jgi:hypothetical protein